MMAGSNGDNKDTAKRQEIDSRKAILKAPKTAGGKTKGGDDPKQPKGK
jgi:hypothetical protein